MARGRPPQTKEQIESIIGCVFSKLTVVEYVGRAGKEQRHTYLCKCSCGKDYYTQARLLRSGNITSCGCRSSEFMIKYNTTHGCCGKPYYKIWSGIRGRCTDSGNRDYKNYGGRGIRMCDRWLNSFEDFTNDIGPRPSDKHSIDRIDNNGNYEPGNCRWATRAEQQNNRRDTLVVEYKGANITLSKLRDLTGLNKSTLRHRIYKLGLSVEDAINRKGRLKK